MIHSLNRSIGVSIASTLLLVVLLTAHVSSSSSNPSCASRASWNDDDDRCECDPGFAGDGSSFCGAIHATSVQLSPTSATSAIIRLPCPTNANRVSLLAVASSESSTPLIYQTDGSNKGSAIVPSSQQPPLITNSKAQVFLEFPANSTDDRVEIRFSYRTNDDTTQYGSLFVETFEPCNALDDLSVTKFGFTKSPELAEVKLSWIDSTFQLKIEVDVPYERDMAVVMIDTEDFDSFNGNVRVRAPGSCSQRPTIPSSVPFAALFESAPTATSIGALSGEFFAYPDASTTGWNVSPIDCATVKYEREFTLSELTSCNDVTANDAIDPTTQAPMVKYAGSLFINTLQPADDVTMNEAAGYAKFTQQFPFELQIYTEFEAVVGVSTDDTRIHIVVRYLRLEGSDMVMLVETQIEGHGLALPSVGRTVGSGATITPDLSSTDTNATPCSTNGDVDLCTQRWVYRQPNWKEEYNTNYDFVWHLFDTPTDSLTVPISLKLRINGVNVLVGKLGDLTLRLYATEGDAQFGAANAKGYTYPWHVTERIFLRGDVMTNPADTGMFTSTYRELWVCYSPIAGYDITVANGGCLDPLIDDTHRVHLVSNGAVQTSMQAAAFRASTVSADNGASSVASAVAFDAFPLTGEPHMYTIHARVVLENTATRQKREVMALFRRDATASPASTARMMILPSDIKNVSSDHDESASTRVTMILGAAGMSCIGMVAMLAGVVIYRKKSNQHHQMVAVVMAHQSISEMDEVTSDDMIAHV